MNLTRDDIITAVRTWLNENGFKELEFTNHIEFPNLLMQHNGSTVGIQIIDIEDADQPKRSIIDAFGYIEKSSAQIDRKWIILVSIGKEITEKREDLADKYIEQYESGSYELTYGYIDSDYKFSG